VRTYAKAGRAFRDPAYKLGNLRMKQKLLDRIVFFRQLPFAQDRMHEFMASPA
jgi:hypothetical protein